MLRSLCNALLSLVFPVECEICRVVLPATNATGVCSVCDSAIRWIPPPHCASCGRHLHEDIRKCGLCLNEFFHYDRAFACALYEGKMRELLHGYKFGRRKLLGSFLVKRMSSFLEANLKAQRFDGILAVPLDREKQNARGFNQSYLISSKLSKRLGIRDASSALRRRKSSSPQSLLTKTDRKNNIKGRFFVTNGDSFGGKKLLLIDDILTSGQTVSECARVLKDAGAASITVLVCARGA